MIRIANVVFFLLMAVSPAVAQNLLVNPGYDDSDQLTGWTCIEAFGTANWSMVDRTASPSSGAMKHEGTASADHRYVTCYQCVPVKELSTYAVSVWHFWPNNLEFSQQGQLRQSVAFYSDADCASQIGTNFITIGTPSSLDTWFQLRSDEATAPASTMSAQVGVITWQLFADQPVQVLYDDIEFSATTVFRDGFEAGNLAAWSTSIP